MSIVPIQSDPAEANCPNCGAAVAADQHYCLNCGRPCAPLRLPFLEVLQAGPQGRSVQAPSGYAQTGYLPPLQQSGGGPLHRYTGLFALIGVLLLTAVIGLLIGHWAIGSGDAGKNGPQVIKLEGLGSAATAPVTSTAATTTAGSTAGASRGSGSKSSKQESKQEEEATKEAKLAPAVKPSSSAVQKLSKETGKQYEQEINKIANGPAPIETGG